MLSVNEEWRGDVALLELVGDFTAGNMQPFYEKVTQLKLLRRWKVLLRLGKVTRIDEAGLGEIMRLTTATRRCGGELAILDPPALMRQVFDPWMGLQYFGVCDSEDEAFAGLRAVPRADTEAK